MNDEPSVVSLIRWRAGSQESIVMLDSEIQVDQWSRALTSSPMRLVGGLLSAAILGLLSAVAIIVSSRFLGSSNSIRNRAALLDVKNSWRRDTFKSQRQAIAAGYSAGSRAKARFSALDEDIKITPDLFFSSGYIPSNETLAEPTSESLDYECGGADAGQTCFDAAQACLTAAESVVSTLYSVDPVSATETRANSVCKCFVVSIVLGFYCLVCIFKPVVGFSN